jgi:pyruvate formate lyase activating enzyme
MKARIVNIQKFSLHDGPGIRTLVFFKGCPLRCLWCDNPECINPMPEIGFNRALCNRCGRCVAVCSQGAMALDGDNIPLINRDRCTACGECVEVCAPKALIIYGRDMSPEEVFAEVSGDAIFYSSSEGGITVSGGEPLLQADYVEYLFKLCHEAGITTAMETCGEVSPEVFKRVLQHVEFVFFDLKSIDEQKHMTLTGKRNWQILDNARMIAGSGVQVQFRMPLIPGLNDDFDNIKATANFLRSLEKCQEPSIELMPYHRLGTGKYEALGREYPLKKLDMASPEAVEMARRRFEECGMTCLVSQ